MDKTNLALFVVASWILVVTPGPDMLYVITRGISQGRKSGVVSAIGVTLGILVHTVFAAFGFAVILKTSAVAFGVMKYLGAVYLVYLGVKTIKDKKRLAMNSHHRPTSLRTVFAQGILSNVLNPKIALFFMAFLPQFVVAEKGHVALQMVWMGVTFAFFGVVFLTLVGYFSGAIGGRLSRNRILSERLSRVTGGLLIALGIRLVFVDRR